MLGIGQPVAFLPAVTFDLRPNFIRRHRPQPGSKSGPGLELVDMVEGEDEGFMGNFVGQVLERQPDGDKRMNMVQVTIQERSERIQSTALNGLNQGFVSRLCDVWLEGC